MLLLYKLYGIIAVAIAEKTKQKNKTKKENKTKKTRNKNKTTPFSNSVKFAYIGVNVLSSHNFGNLGGQLKTRYDETLGEKRKGDPYHKRLSASGHTTK